ncbi:LytR/AlgR family response regulator transcription factor [Costertonia aggregata]|uniref:Response regulator transcription factor n=1 Tax=Costertonia aggregata TaxID=343403 RepID=A0A7H9ALY2_9FLAO|nr:LytTR family DNA-binding domain-containing protein [Costertonia aggregata]QLG44383.1 response regulator transcription factor [Costertonia aggregata]
MIKAILIDDEAKARQGLRLVLEKYCPAVAILALCESPEIGLEKIKTLKPDLVFLDVQMPKMSGFDVLERIPEINFEVIFVTAYDRYAIKAIKFSALDYLLKPIDVDELVAAVNKISLKQQDKSHQYKSLFNNVKSDSEKLKRLAIPSDNEIIMQPIADIIYCEADSSYTTLFLTNKKKITVSKTLKEFENILPETDFCRIHHSTLVNMAHVVKYIKGEGGYVIISNDGHLNVSRRKKEHFLEMLYQG